MQLEVRSQNVDLADALQGYIERRMRFSLSRFGPRVGRVKVRLSDVNGPRGGVDKSCRASVQVLPSGNVVVEETALSLFTAIDRVADRLGECVSRQVGRGKKAKGSRESVRTTGELQKIPYSGSA
ncbi:MAG: HPF/RaiA family ribosome-associated protein [Terriglobia bacterium]